MSARCLHASHDCQNWGRDIADKEFVVSFDDNNQLVIRELPVDMRRVPLLDFETCSSKDEMRSEWVEALPKIS